MLGAGCDKSDIMRKVADPTEAHILSRHLKTVLRKLSQFDSGFRYFQKHSNITDESLGHCLQSPSKILTFANFALLTSETLREYIIILEEQNKSESNIL